MIVLRYCIVGSAGLEPAPHQSRVTTHPLRLW
nr:MAG TPA: hypothetical protein [Bacteriophage sp.]